MGVYMLPRTRGWVESWNRVKVLAYLGRRLTEEGYDFDLNLDETGGVAYAELHFRTLTRTGRERRETAAGKAG